LTATRAPLTDALKLNDALMVRAPSSDVEVEVEVEVEATGLRIFFSLMAV